MHKARDIKEIKVYTRVPSVLTAKGIVESNGPATVDIYYHDGKATTFKTMEPERAYAAGELIKLRQRLTPDNLDFVQIDEEEAIGILDEQIKGLLPNDC